MRKLETVRNELEAANRRLAELQNTRLLIPKAEAIAAADAFIEQCAARARAFLGAAAIKLVDRAGWPPRLVDDGMLFAHKDVADRLQDFVALAAGPALRGELVAAVEQIYAGNVATMSEADRLQALADVRKRIDTLEREEVAICNATGAPLRADTRPELILGLD